MDENNSSKLHEGGGGGRMGRTALGNVTNQMESRGFKLVSRSPASKSVIGNKRGAENSDDGADSQLWKQVSVVVDKLEKERCHVVKCPKLASRDVGLSPLKGGKTYSLHRNSFDVGAVSVSGVMGTRDFGVETKGDHGSVFESIDVGENRDLVNVVNVDDRVQVGVFSSECCEKGCAEVGKESQGDCSPETLAAQVVSDTRKSVAVEFMTSSKSQEIKSFGLQRCTLLEGDGSNDLLKNCTCSFCTKAAYIWSDLQCQDVKGRISSLMKSQKDANNFVLRYNVLGGAQVNSSKASQLDIDLTNLWKSLFLHMENVYTAESSQLQTNFVTLKDLREDCKMNLEMINATLSDTPQCSSDTSHF